MNISYKWLKEYVSTTLTAQEIAEALTSIGLEVGALEEVQTIRGGLKGLVVAEVLTCEAHPDSDHMHVCSVNIGAEAPVQIVCGAPNVAAGQKVIAATLGTVLYDGDKEFVIKKSKLRGVESYGMLCAEDEIGVGNSHDGIIVLPADAVVGTSAAEYYHVESDWLIEVDITPNRADACSHYGVARDLYAYLRRHGIDTALTRPSVDDFKPEGEAFDFNVRIENTEACPHYCAVAVMDCDVKESPDWLKNKLLTIGLRPVNNVVDITNYVMFAVGQPLHCFDADMIAGREIVVKSLPEGTPFVTLDGVEHQLSERDLAICNAEEAMCIAGVFGGKGSGTYENTRNVVLESAYFHPTWIRKSARRHGLNTDASFRFERGIDPAGQMYAVKLAALLIKEVAGGRIASEVKEVVGREIPLSFPVELGYDYVTSIIGQELGADMVKTIVSALEMKIEAETTEGLTLSVPAYRVDVQRPCDVVEDILRIYGYNSVETSQTMKSALTLPTEDDRSHRLLNLIGEQLVGAGFNEILNNSLTKEGYYADLKSHSTEQLVRLLNPLSSDLNVLRSTMLFGGLESIAHNVNRRRANLRIYESGNCYHFDATRKESEKLLAPYTEEEMLALWITGQRVEDSWAHANEEMSVYELKADVLNILTRLGLNLRAYVIKDGESDLFSKSLVVADRNGKVFAEFGQVRKALCAGFDIEQPVYYAELYWTRLMKATRKHEVTFAELSKFPAVRRDLALLIDSTTPFSAIEQIAFAAEKKLLKAVELFDVYEGEHLPKGKKSYAVAFTLQDDTKTMNDKQVEAIMKKIIGSLQHQLGAQLR
ncbi:MAG: phenylalanine--tRNA ligase subunit beta [Alloprevotella sp.]|nr:phenylalanine--tRNA ligase subunit beta [Alloprevotella sp.]